MRLNKFNKNIRFSYFLPYGIIGPAALELSVNMPADAYIEYSSKPMNEREESCIKAHMRRLAAIRSMEEYGYIECISLKYGKRNYEQVRLYRLTQSGLYVLTNTPDDAVEKKRLETAYKAPNRNEKEETYLPMDDFSVSLRNTLFEFAEKKHDSQEDSERFEKLFLSSVENGLVGLLAREPYLAKAVSVIPNLKAQQIYRAYRQMNIESMFYTIGCLTSKDRRHIENNRAPASPEEILAEKRELDVKAFTDWTLFNWYKDHPESYCYLSPLTDKEEPQVNPATGKVKPSWRETAAYYSVQELSGFKSIEKIEVDMNVRGAIKIMRYSCDGVAVGMRTNYLVYHTRQKGTPWNETIEKNSAASAQYALNMENENNPIFGASREIRNALIFCPTIQQFGYLFTNAKRYIPQVNRGYGRHSAAADKIGAPFDSVCIVPINHSGVYQLQNLMMFSPVYYDEILTSAFIQKYKTIGFTKNNDFVYPLSYQGKPILLAHSMNFQRLYAGYLDYQEGKKFLVACYPEQVKYIKRIMPEVEFL